LNAAKFEPTSKESDEVLRNYLRMVSERLRQQARPVEDVGLTKINFRLIVA
jgi:hypothetical protein